MSDSVPAVSILLPVHNGLPYLEEALEDLLGQTFRQFELVAVNDASTDDTLSVLESYAARDERVVVVNNETNLGLPRTLNRGLKHCRADLVARADADDRYAEDRLARQVRFMHRNLEVGLLSSAYHKMNAAGQRYRAVYAPTKNAQIKMRELFVNSFSHPGVMFRKRLVEAVGGYNPEFWTAEDVELWFRLQAVTKVANLAVPLVDYRTHEKSMVQTQGAEVKSLDLQIRQRALSRYLGRRVPMEAVRVAVALYRGRFVPDWSEFAEGHDVLTAVLERAQTSETAGAVRYYRQQVALSLLRLSVSARDAAYRRVLLKEALRFHWRSPLDHLLRRVLSLMHRAAFAEDVLVWGPVSETVCYLTSPSGLRRAELRGSG